MDNLVRKVNALYDKKRQDNKVEQAKRKREVYRAMPRVKAIDQEIANIAHRVMLNVFDSPQVAQSASVEMRNISAHLSHEKKNILRQNKLPDNYLDPIYDCKVCKDRGYLDDGKRCSCFQETLLKLAYSDSTLKNRLLKDNFDTFNLNVFNTEVIEGDTMSQRDNIKIIVERTLAFINDFDVINGDNLLFYGNTGLGKTFLCSSIAKRLIDANKNVVYQTSKEFFEILNQNRFTQEYTKEESKTIRFKARSLYSCDLLIIDDLGTEYIGSFTLSDLFDVLNHRLINEKKTIISTNYNMSEINNAYGERIASRLMGEYIKLKFIGRDLRY